MAAVSASSVPVPDVPGKEGKSLVAVMSVPEGSAGWEGMTLHCTFDTFDDARDWWEFHSDKRGACTIMGGYDVGYDETRVVKECAGGCASRGKSCTVLRILAPPPAAARCTACLIGAWQGGSWWRVVLVVSLVIPPMPPLPSLPPLHPVPPVSSPPSPP